MEWYCWDKDRASETLGARFIGCQIPYQLQNLKILSTFEGHKSPHSKFLEFEFPHLKIPGYIDITRTKINL